MKHFKDIEELIIDDSFINYCFRSDKDDVAYWNHFVEKHPEERDKIEEARRIVLGLRTALSEKHEAEDAKNALTTYPRKIKLRSIFQYTSIAAAVIAAIFVVRMLLKPTPDSDIRSTFSEVVADKSSGYQTKKGERKLITLADSTKIWLNADSELKIGKNYGKKDRNVYLVGEALFDVQHDEKIPFIVFTDNYQVKDLGTVFNVKAYPGDEVSEASLIQGKIEVAIKGVEEIITLEPNQKFILNNESVAIKSLKSEKAMPKPLIALGKDAIALAPLSYSSSDSTVLETSWVDRLEIENESLYQMKNKLERWYGVDIKIEDPQVGAYPFTATFKDESIDEVLQALQYAYPFKFKIENNEVTIEK